MQSRFRIGAAPRKRLIHERRQKHASQKETSQADTTGQLIVTYSPKAEQQPGNAKGLAGDQRRIQVLLNLPSPWRDVPMSIFSHFQGEPHMWTSEFCRTLQFYVWEILPIFRPVYTIFGVFNIYESYLSRRVKPSILQAWDTSISYVMAKLAPDLIDWPQYYSRHGRVLANLRQKVFYAIDNSAEVDEELIEMMIFLINLSLVNKDPAVAEIHVMKVRQLLATLSPGFLSSQMSRHVQSFSAQWEYNWTLARPRHTRLFRNASTNLPVDNMYLRDPYAIETLPTGFQRLVTNDRLSSSSIEVLYRLSIFSRDPDSALRHEDSSLYRSDHKDFYSACPCLESETMTFEKLLCLTVYIFCNIAFPARLSAFEAYLSFRAPRDTLSLAILTFSTDSSLEKVCVQWIWMVIIRMWRNSNGTYAITGSELMAEFQNRHPELKWDMIEQTLFDFFWTPSLSDEIHLVWHKTKLQEA